MNRHSHQVSGNTHTSNKTKTSNSTRTNRNALLKGMMLGVLLTAGAGLLILGIFSDALLNDNHSNPQHIENTNETQTPLYWVAPMDPNYRRDKPGKSPMGMDLVPVYKTDSGANVSENRSGTVSVSANIEQSLGVKTSIASLQVLPNTVNTVGYVQYNHHRMVHVHPRLEGWIDQLYVKAAGDSVQQGEPIFSLYSPELVNAQEEFLLASNTNNRLTQQAAKSRLRALQMPENALKTLIKTQKVQNSVIFTAPQNGVIAQLNIHEGFFVKPADTLMAIAALDEVWLEAEVFEQQAALIQTEQPVSITLSAFPGRTWLGKVDYIYPTLNAQTRTLRVRLRFANPDLSLKPNMFATVTINARSNEKVLTVPSSAVIRTQHNERVVLSLGDGKFRSVSVITGQRSGNVTQILSGISGGDQVVTSAQFLLDSESALFEDLSRYSQPEPPAQKAETSGTIVEMSDPAQGATQLTIHRNAIDKWQQPPATITFDVADYVNTDYLQTGQQVMFRFEIRQRTGNHRQFIITAITPASHGQHRSPDHQNTAQSGAAHD